ncbi:MAG: nucleotidyltransferase domain-containing protein [Bacteroidales bacterium]|nr:nucleotidyltransferase domain-containing protein [Bacteroidales bacterium]
MVKLLKDRLREVEELCRKYDVRRLFVFGSVLTSRFCEKSDIDFAVDFNQDAIDNLYDNFYSLHQDLIALFNRPIDLIENDAIRNPYFLSEYTKTRQLIYGPA